MRLTPLNPQGQSFYVILGRKLTVSEPLNKHVIKAFKRLTEAGYEGSDREFRLGDCRGGRSLAAFKSRRFEKAMNQACKCLDKEEDHFPYEEVIALKVLKLSLEKVDPDKMNRPEIIFPKLRIG